MRRWCDKRGDFNVMLVVIVTVVVGLLLLIIGYQMNKKSKDLDDDQKCQMSIFANAQSAKVRKESKGFLEFPFSFECDRKSIKIELEDVEKYGRIDDNLFKTVVAEELKGCWAKVGAGKLDPWAGKDVNEKFCLACSEFYLSDKLAEQIKKQNYVFKGFQYWIAANKLPGIKTSLYEFIRGNRPTPELLSALKQNENSPDSAMDFVNNKYVVVWRVTKKETGFWQSVGAAVVGGAAAVAGVVFLPATAVGAAIVGTAAVASGGVAGFGLGNLIDSGSDSIFQQALLVPEDALSAGFDFGDGKGKRELCTVMIN